MRFDCVLIDSLFYRGLYYSSLSSLIQKLSEPPLNLNETITIEKKSLFSVLNEEDDDDCDLSVDPGEFFMSSSYSFSFL